MEKTLLKPTEYCGSNGQIKYAGVHLIIELWNAKYLKSLPKIKQILENAVQACQATLLSIDLHQFSPNGGVSGVAIIQESHVSIHTWPEYNYAAVDIFVCGTIDPYKAIPVLKAGFQPKELQVVEVKRGILAR
jgi:S-adenosylmethionine decarboxylase